jgi:biotin carboxylase
MTNKGRFREFQHRHGLPAPSFTAGSSFDAVWDAIRTSQVPLVFKPVDSSGSRGVSLVQLPILDQCQTAFDRAKEYSRTRTVCVEEYLQGTEVGGDAFLLEGRIAFAVTTCKHRNGFVVTGHSLPGSLRSEDEERVVEAIGVHCELLGYIGGPLNFDAMVCGRLVTVIEMSPRTGGNGIPWLINRYTGVDLEAATVCWAMGDNVAFSSKAAGSRRGCGSFVVGSPRAGKLSQIATPEELAATVPNVADVILIAQQGDVVQAFEHGGNMIGCVLFDCDTAAMYDRLVNRIEQVLDVRVADAGEEQ